jgi:class 3 adenylate cyclase
MPMFMDVHAGLGDATAEDVAAAHARDLEVQGKHGVQYLTYWLNDPAGQVFCLVEAPSKEAAVACHKEAHGLMPHNIIEVRAPTVGHFLGDWEQSVPDRATVAGPGSEPDRGIRAIMFTDLEGSTDISTRLGDDVVMDVLRAHNAVVRDCLTESGGREVKHTGDGLMASFLSAGRAVECTMAIQLRIAENTRQKPDPSAKVRIGVSAGEPVTDRDDLFGAAVNLAARICSHAQPAQILVSGTVRDLSIGKPFEFLDQGMIPLKGFPEPVRLYEVPWTF